MRFVYRHCATCAFFKTFRKKGTWGLCRHPKGPCDDTWNLWQEKPDVCPTCGGIGFVRKRG